jgi:hypothetical protein
MLVKGMVWYGLRTTAFEETTHLLRDVMGMAQVRAEATVAGFRVNEQLAIEIYRPEDADHAFFTTGPVVGFLVDDVDTARSEMQRAGIEFIGEIQRAGNAKWNHFHMPDGTVCEIISRG